MSKDINNNSLPTPRTREGRNRWPPQSVRFSQNVSYISQGNLFEIPENAGSIHPFEHFDRFNHQLYNPGSRHLPFLCDTPILRGATRNVYSPMDIPDDPRLSSSDSNSSNLGMNLAMDQSWASGAQGGIGGRGRINHLIHQRETFPGRSRSPYLRGTRFHSRKRPIENTMEVVNEPPASESSEGAGPPLGTTGDNQQGTQAMDTDMADRSSVNGYFKESKRSRYGNSLFAPPRRLAANRQRPHPQLYEDTINGEGGEGIVQAAQSSSQDSRQPQHVDDLETPPRLHFRRHYRDSDMERRERAAQSRQQPRENQNQVHQRSESLALALKGDDEDEMMVLDPTDNFNSEGGAGAP